MPVFWVFVRGPSSHCTFPHGPLGQEEDVLTPAPCTAAHSCTQAPPPQGPGSTANSKAYSSHVGFRAEGKLGIKGGELRIPPHLGRLPSRGKGLQASKGIWATKCINALAQARKVSLSLTKPDLYPDRIQFCTFFLADAQRLLVYLSFKFKISRINTR